MFLFCLFAPTPNRQSPQSVLRTFTQKQCEKIIRPNY